MKLYSKLALSILLLLVSLGTVLIYISAKTSEMYSLEITQQINRDIAVHAAEDMPLISHGQANEQALKELAHHIMVINPIVEVYLLDKDGAILSHALPQDTVILDRVNTQPLKEFLSGDRPLPIFGDDPRSSNQKKVFSVSPITDNNETVAYLYTVLNGKKYDNLHQSLQESYNLKVGTVTIIISVLIAAIVGLILFALLTRRLQKLIEKVRVYRKSSAQGPQQIAKRSITYDEIDELDQALTTMNQRIEEQFKIFRDVDTVRRELIANVSHDLRTPLTSMQGYIETLLIKNDQLAEADKKHYLETAYKHSRRLNQLVGELFELAKLESVTAELNCESFSLLELLQDLVQDYELQTNKRDITLAVHCEHSGCSVNADISLIHRVLENLLQNALRHTGDNGEISINVHQEDQKVWVEVEDNGVGIASQDIPYIFDRYYRPEASNTHDGNGLGLAIVKRILELHQSQVTVRSEPNHGSIFSFWLPQTN